MSVYTFVLVLVGITAATGWLFRLVERIEGRR